jgi:hypothetical protein
MHVAGMLVAAGVVELDSVERILVPSPRGNALSHQRAGGAPQSGELAWTDEGDIRDLASRAAHVAGGGVLFKRVWRLHQ